MSKEHKDHQAVHHEHQEHSKAPKMNWSIVALVLVLVFCSALAATWIGFNAGKSVLGTQQVAVNTTALSSSVESYINENFIADKTVSAKIIDVNDFGNGLYELSYEIYQNGAKVSEGKVFATEEKLILGTAFDLSTPLPKTNTQADAQAQAETETLSLSNIKKANAPLLEAFVVSQCPYGLQMQRALAPVAESFNSNVKVLYLGAISNGKITSMHGDAEAQENLRQICIREEQSAKYWNYVSCYMQQGKSEECLNTASVDKTKLATCISDASKGLAYAQKDFDRHDEIVLSIAQRKGIDPNTVSIASPGLFINGDAPVNYNSNYGTWGPDTEYSFAASTNSGAAPRSPENLKQIVCAAFNNAPGTCTSTVLSKESVATSFSVSTAGTSTTAGSCGN